MRRTRTTFRVAVILLSLMQVAGALPAYAASITIDSVERFVTGFGGGPSSDQINFGTARSSSLGLFNEIASGSGTVLVSFFSRPDPITTLGSVAGAAYQFSNVSLLDDILTVDAAIGTSLTMSTSSPLPPDASSTSWQGEALSSLRLTFTLHDWASYNATHFLAGNVQWGARSIDRPEVSLTSASFSAFHEFAEVNDRHSGLLAPGTYEYTLVSGGGTDFAGAFFGGSSTYATSLVVTSVAEPSSLLLLACAIGLLAAARSVRWRQIY